jgi:hypothetical protein
MICDMIKYVLKSVNFTTEAISIIYWDIDVPRSPGPHKVCEHNGHPGSQYNSKKDFSEDTDGIVASLPWQLMKTQWHSQAL